MTIQEILVVTAYCLITSIVLFKVLDFIPLVYKLTFKLTNYVFNGLVYSVIYAVKLLNRCVKGLVNWFKPLNR